MTTTPTPECYDVDGSRRLVVTDHDQHRCHCGAAGKPNGDEPTAGGSVLYVCSASGAPLGYSGL